ncbi:mediator of RNA polymerase II transcription subunit 16 [Eupeodes corollae]|uniref:mediator of RNA polymerase II transcription subunit 16 n=1 Tax=Eupeodes corollae TaxID=290404 RepID=UPI0024919A89|nr:mediator of RNA polymerase II transcription subunit 16 [Eupeodes corollae]
MELLYSVKKKKVTISNWSVPNIPTTCKVSSQNIVAFATANQIMETLTNTVDSWGSHVYVCDIIAPWHVFKVCSNKYPITVLEWSISGDYLLTGDTGGFVKLWTQKAQLINDWIPVYSVHFDGEEVINCKFFHNGRKLVFPSEKRDAAMYLDKFVRIKYPPSVRQFGGVGAEGCLVVTSSGLLGAFLIPQLKNSNINGEGPPSVPPTIELSSVTHSLGLTRNFVTTVTVAHGKTSNHSSGHFRIAIASGEQNRMMIQCFRIMIQLTDGKPIISSQSLPSFFLYEGAGRDIANLKISQLRWETEDEAESVIVVANNYESSFVEQWTLVQKITPIHKFLQINKTEVFQNTSWENVASMQYPNLVVDICVSKVVFDNPFVFLMMSDNSIQVLGRGFKKFTSSLPVNKLVETDISCRQPRTEMKLAALDVTFMGHLLVCFDNCGQMYVLKVPQAYHEQCTNQMALVAHKVSLLEYSIMTGFDATDMFMLFRSNILDAVIEKLSENFTRQPSYVQQFNYVSFLTLKTNLCRMQVSGQSRANDLNSLLMLHSVLIAFKSLLRPSDLTSHDKGPAENLAMVLSESVPDVDKVLFNLDAKDFTVEPPTLQSLQQLIQWVADLALNILAKLPQNIVQHNKNNGYDISKDIVALNSIRELLVMIRIWGLLNTHCLPMFLKSIENLDILATLFRLLTRLALNPSEPDEVLLDECCVLPTQVLIPQLQTTTSNVSLNSPLIFYKPPPLFFTYNVELDFIKVFNEQPQIEGFLCNDGVLDSVRNIQLGKKPVAVRQCLRCGAFNSFTSVAKTAAMKAWEQRWNRCRCGGYWKLTMPYACKQRTETPRF